MAKKTRKTKKTLSVNKKSKVFTWNVTKDLVESYADKLQLSDKQLQKLDNAIQDHLGVIKSHFKQDGWDLDSNFYTDEVIADVIGNVKDYVMFKLLLSLKGKANLVFDPNKDMNKLVFRKVK
jgi:hypothetical protein